MEQSLKFLVPNYNQNRDLTFGDRVEMRHFAPEEKKCVWKITLTR